MLFTRGGVISASFCMSLRTKISKKFQKILDRNAQFVYNFRVTINNDMNNDIYNVSHETLSLFQKVKDQMANGNKFFVEVTLDDEIKTGELVNTFNWSSSRVVVKFNDGSILRVPMNNVTNIEC